MQIFLKILKTYEKVKYSKVTKDINVHIVNNHDNNSKIIYWNWVKICKNSPYWVSNAVEIGDEYWKISH
jgi:hypothetical protein